MSRRARFSGDELGDKVGASHGGFLSAMLKNLDFVVRGFSYEKQPVT